MQSNWDSSQYSDVDREMSVLMLIRSWDVSTGTDTGCQHCKWWLSLLLHDAGPRMGILDCHFTDGDVAQKSKIILQESGN